MSELVLNTEIKNAVALHFRRIANVLHLNGSIVKNPGLLNGKMRIAIFMCKYARQIGKMYEDYHGDLIDEINEEINTLLCKNF